MLFVEKVYVEKRFQVTAVFSRYHWSFFHSIRWPYLISYFSFWCKMRFQAYVVCCLLSDVILRWSQFAISVWFKWFKLAIACNLFMLIQQLTVINGQKSNIYCYHIFVSFIRNSYWTTTFILNSFPNKKDYNQNTSSSKPAESSLLETHSDWW